MEGLESQLIISAKLDYQYLHIPIQQISTWNLWTKRESCLITLNKRKSTQMNKFLKNFKRESLIWSVLSKQFLMTIKPNTLTKSKPPPMIITVRGSISIFAFSKEIGSINSDNLSMLFLKWSNPYFLLLLPLFCTLMKQEIKSVTFRTLEV